MTAPAIDTTEPEDTTADVGTPDTDEVDTLGLLDDDSEDEGEDSDAIEGDAPESPDADAAVSTDEKPPEPVAEAPTEPEQPPEPVIMSVKGRDVPLRGVSFDPKNGRLLMADERAQKRVHGLMLKGLEREAERDTGESVEVRHKQELDAATAVADRFMESLVALKDLTPQEALAQVENLIAALPEIQHQMALQKREEENAKLRAQLEAKDAFPTPAEDELYDWADSQSDAKVMADAASGKFAWMTPKAAESMKAYMQQPAVRSQYLLTATAAHVREFPHLKVGQPFVDDASWYRAASLHARAWMAAHEESVAAKAQAAKQLQTREPLKKMNDAIVAHANKTPAVPPKAAAPVRKTKAQREQDAREAYEANANEAIGSMFG